MQTGEPGHFGKWLKREIASALLGQREWAKTHGISFDTLKVWLASDRPKIRGTNLARLSRAVGRPIEEIEAFIASGWPGNPHSPPITLAITGRISAAKIRAEGDDTNAPDVLTIDPQSEFLIRIDGDCMEPDWHDGELVLFSMKEVESRGIIDGEDYAIRFCGGGETTFKRVFLDAKNPDKVILRCVNRRAHRKEMIIKTADISRIGKAVLAVRRPKRKGQ